MEDKLDELIQEGESQILIDEAEIASMANKIIALKEKIKVKKDCIDYWEEFLLRLKEVKNKWDS